MAHQPEKSVSWEFCACLIIGDYQDDSLGRLCRIFLSTRRDLKHRKVSGASDMLVVVRVLGGDLAIFKGQMEG